MKLRQAKKIARHMTLEAMIHPSVRQLRARRICEARLSYWLLRPHPGTGLDSPSGKAYLKSISRSKIMRQIFKDAREAAMDVMLYGSGVMRDPLPLLGRSPADLLPLLIVDEVSDFPKRFDWQMALKRDFGAKIL